MPVFTSAATALLASTSLAGSVIATNIVASALAVGTGHLLGVFDEPDLPTPADPGVNIRLGPNTTNRLPLLYGDWQVRGIEVYATTSDDNQQAHYVLALGEDTRESGGSAATIETITYESASHETCYWNEWRLILDPTDKFVVKAYIPDPDDPDDYSDALETTDKFNDKIRVEFFGAGGHSTYIEGKNDEWDNTHTMSNITYVTVSLTYDRDAGITGLADMRFRGTSDITNPAEAVRDLLTNSRYGLGLSTNQIDSTSFTTAISDFNATVNIGNSATFTPRSRIDGVVSTGISIKDRISTILRGGYGYLKWSNGKWGIFINKEETADAFEFDESNIIGSINVTEPGYNNLFNKVTVIYNGGEAYNYQERTYTASEAETDPVTRELNITLPLTRGHTEAIYRTLVEQRASKEQLTISHRATLAALPLEVGDVITYSDSDFGWSSKEFRVVSKTLVETDGRMEFQIESVEYADAIYQVNIPDDNLAPNAAAPVVEDLAAVSDLATTGRFPRAATPYIELEWTVPSAGAYNAFDVFYNVNGSVFNSTTTIFSHTVRLPDDAFFTNSSTVNTDVTGIPPGNISLWVRGRNDFARSAESNRVVASNWNPIGVIGGTEDVYRYNETPSVIDGTDIDVGAPPANATGTGTGRNNNSNDTGWYEFDPDASDRENAPVWTAVTSVTRAGAEPRILDFTASGTTGDTVVSVTPVAQVIDYDFTGTVGQQTLQYAARPRRETFTFSGQAAEADSVDPGVEEVWKIDVTGDTDATASAANEQFYIYPQGSSNTYSPETFTLTPSGDTSDGEVTPINIGDDSTYTFTNSSSVLPRASVENSSNVPQYGLTSSSSITNPRVRVRPTGDIFTTVDANVELIYGETFSNNSISRPSDTTTWAAVELKVSGGGVTFTLTNPAEILTTTNNGGLVFISDSQTSHTITGTGTMNQNDSLTITLTAASATQSSVTLTLDGSSNTYTLADDLSGAAAVGSALNTAIGTDYDSGYTKTFDSSTGVITFTADDDDDHTGSISVVQGTNGTLAVALGNTAPSGTATTIRVQVPTDSIDETIELSSNISGSTLQSEIATKFEAAFPDAWTVETASVDINDDNTDEAIVRFTADDNTDHTFSVTINSGLTGTTSGTITDGTEATTATTIRLTYDADLSPVTQDITFSANATAAAVAGELAEMLNDHGDLTATQGTVVVESSEEVRQDPTNALDQITFLGYITGDPTPESTGEYYIQSATDLDFDDVTTIDVGDISDYSVGDYICLFVSSTLYNVYSITTVGTDSIEVSWQSSLSNGGTSHVDDHRSITLLLGVPSTGLPSVFTDSNNGFRSVLVNDPSPDVTSEIFISTSNSDWGDIGSIRVDDSFSFSSGHNILVVSDSTNYGFYDTLSSEDDGSYDTVSVALKSSEGSYTYNSFRTYLAALSTNANATLTLEDVTSTTFTEDTTAASVLVKPDIVGDQSQPTITVTTQGTGTAAFSVSTELPGRIAVAGSPRLTSYSVSNAGTEVLSGNFASGVDSDGAAVILRNLIDNLSTYGIHSSSASVFTTQTATNLNTDLEITITSGTNGSGASSTNNLAVVNTITQIGSATDVNGGTDAVITVNVDDRQYYQGTYGGGTIESIIDDLVLGIDAVVSGFTTDERWDADKQDSDTMRVTSLGTGTEPSIDILIAAGSTASSDSVGNVTTTAATLSAAATVINDGEDESITSGELSTFTVTQGSDTLVNAQALTGGISSSAAAVEIANAISDTDDAIYSTSVSGSVITATLDENNNTPDLTISVAAGKNTDDSAANFAVSKSIEQAGSIGTLDLTNAVWNYFISAPTVDDDTLMVDDNGVITARRGVILDSTETDKTSADFTTTTLEFDDTHTTGDRIATLVLTGSVALPAVTTTTTGGLVGFILEYSTNGDDDTPTWTAIQTSPQVTITTTSTYSGQIVPIPLGISATLDADADTTYWFRVRRNAANDGLQGLTANLLILEELRAASS